MKSIILINYNKKNWTKIPILTKYLKTVSLLVVNDVSLSKVIFHVYADSCKSDIGWLYCGNPVIVCGGVVDLSLLREDGLEETH